ncbi:zinc finger protein 131-like isoform 4-T9 [Guaruba guarouba]
MEAEEMMECIQEFPEHYKAILNRLNEQREQDQFTDITLIVDGHHFKAHKAVLAACSQFFYNFFQDFTQEPLVEIEGVSNMAFRHLIEFTYTAKLMIQGEEEANDVWKAAEYLQMLEAIKALKIRNKEISSPLESNQTQDKNKPKKRKVADTSHVLTETLPPAESEPVEIEVEIAEGMIEVEDDSIETLEVASAEQSIKYIQTTGTSDASALALLADITSKYHQGERKCQIQEEDDSASDTLCKQEHMKTHSTERYRCDICKKRYLRETALKQHLTCYHLDEGGASKKQRPGKKIHICQYCDKQFDHVGHFKEHLRKHTGEKPFECPNCHERFARNSTLKCHLAACQSGAGARKGRKKLYECQSLMKSPSPASLKTSFRYWKAAMRSPRSLLFSRLTPEQYTVLQVRSHESRVEGQDHLPRPAGHAPLDAAQHTVGFLGWKRTLLAHVKLLINQHPQVLFRRAALNLFSAQPGAVPGIAPTQEYYFCFLFYYSV